MTSVPPTDRVAMGPASPKSKDPGCATSAIMAFHESAAISETKYWPVNPG